MYTSKCNGVVALPSFNQVCLGWLPSIQEGAQARGCSLPKWSTVGTTELPMVSLKPCCKY